MLNYSEICTEMHDYITKVDVCAKANDMLEEVGYYHSDLWYAINEEWGNLQLNIELILEEIHADLTLRNVLIESDSEKFNWIFETDCINFNLKTKYSVEFIGMVAEIFNGADFSADYDYTVSQKWLSVIAE